MPLFIAPQEYKEAIMDHLKEKHPDLVWKEQILTFEDARKLVFEMCGDKKEKQPAVKLLSIYHSLIVSIWLGTELRVYDGFAELNNAEPAKKKFLFHGEGRREPWALILLS